MTTTSHSSPEPRRCPTCDSVVAPDAARCLMCGTPLQPPPAPADLPPAAAVPAEPAPAEPTPPDALPTDTAQPATPLASAYPLPSAAPSAYPLESAAFETTPRQRPSRAATLLTLVAALAILVVGSLVLRFQGPVSGLALFPTPSPIPPTPSYTPTWTPIPTETPRPSQTPTVTPMPSPTLTLQPPFSHQVQAGETLIGLAVRYQVSTDSIASLNGFAADAPLQAGQALLIPLPTATPPLVPVAREVNGELVIADPTDCERYQVQAGDSLSGIAARADVDFELFLEVNRLTAEHVLQPGELLCIPIIVYGGTLPPTPGPTPTPSPTAPLPGPQLLYPPAETAVSPPDAPLTLQWLAVKDLAPDEWYMVEVANLDRPADPPHRAFSRDTAYRVPAAWRPDRPETERFRWRVSIVRVTGERGDGQFLYTYGGQRSADGFFTWLGAIPTPTPTQTPTPFVSP